MKWFWNFIFSFFQGFFSPAGLHRYERESWLDYIYMPPLVSDGVIWESLNVEIMHSLPLQFFLFLLLPQLCYFSERMDVLKFSDCNNSTQRKAGGSLPFSWCCHSHRAPLTICPFIVAVYMLNSELAYSDMTGPVLIPWLETGSSGLLTLRVCWTSFLRKAPEVCQRTY